mmetsp:Transcript_4252/g.12006  ORF Transcript_4252/g.12006 Transcript_4252/m.12006 type:complete len:307 (-) Transcript_4252:388-1308(-)
MVGELALVRQRAPAVLLAQPSLDLLCYAVVLAVRLRLFAVGFNLRLAPLLSDLHLGAQGLLNVALHVIKFLLVSPLPILLLLGVLLLPLEHVELVPARALGHLGTCALAVGILEGQLAGHRFPEPLLALALLLVKHLLPHGVHARELSLLLGLVLGLDAPRALVGQLRHLEALGPHHGKSRFVTLGLLLIGPDLREHALVLQTLQVRLLLALALHDANVLQVGVPRLRQPICVGLLPRLVSLNELLVLGGHVLGVALLPLLLAAVCGLLKADLVAYLGVEQVPRILLALHLLLLLVVPLDLLELVE